MKIGWKSKIHGLGQSTLDYDQLSNRISRERDLDPLLFNERMSICMALENAIPPAEAGPLLADALNRLSAVGGGAADAVKPEALGRLAKLVHTRCTLWIPSTSPAVNSSAPARLVAWRFLILDRQTAIGAIELVLRP